MAIIQPSRNFAGSDLNQSGAAPVLKGDVRSIRFNSPEYRDGTYLFILPPYKMDDAGNGAWYRTINVRDNFGQDVMKERFFDPPSSPIAYFERMCKSQFPDFAEIKEEHRDGRRFKVYPPYGRISKRVLFNVAFCQDLSKGAHVVEVPSYGCASEIDKHHKRLLPDGSQPTLVCDPQNATAVFFQLQKDAQGNPWNVTVDNSKTYQLPEQLCDADYLYNLDEVVIEYSDKELLEKLRAVVPGNIFDSCMAGFHGVPSAPTIAVPAGAPTSAPTAPAASPGASPPTASTSAEEQIPMGNTPAPQAVPSVAPSVPQTVEFPKATVAGGSPATPADTPNPTAPASAEANPMASPGGHQVSLEQAKNWLKG